MDKYLKGYYQYVTCATRADKILDRRYGPIPVAYRSLSIPPHGPADHNIAVFCIHSHYKAREERSTIWTTALILMF